MTPPRFLRNVALLALASTVIYAPSCASDKQSASQSSSSLTADVVVQGAATQAALSEFVGTTPDVWAWAGGEISAPTSGAVLSAGAPATFAWYTDTSGPDGGPGGPAPGSAVDAGATGALGPLRPGAGRVVQRLLGVLGPERAAWADGAPLTGPAYMLVFGTQSQPRLVRLFTTLTTYTPDAAAWGKLVAAGEPITVQLSAAIFDTDKLAIDGGPHTGQAVTFTIQ